MYTPLHLSRGSCKKTSRQEAARGAASGSACGATIVIEDLHDPTLAKYTFQMSLHLRQSAPGRWNRLDMLEYASLHLETGEVVPIPHKHNKPFFFSRVVSYGA